MMGNTAVAIRRTLLVSAPLFFVAGCPSTPTTPSPAGPMTGIACPVIAAPITTGCPGVVLNNVTITCSSAPTVTFAAGSNRLGVVVPNGSTVTGMLAPTAPGTCSPPGGIPFTITFGVDYIGDPSPTTPTCVRRSKAVLTQYSIVFTGTIWDAAVEGLFRDSLHLEIDKVLRSLTNPAPLAPGASPRCATWTALP